MYAIYAVPNLKQKIEKLKFSSGISLSHSLKILNSPPFIIVIVG